MPASPKPQNSPLLHVLQNQVVPWVEQRGIENLIVARSSWKAMQAADQKLPQGAYLAQETLQSQRVRVKGKLLFGGDAAQVDAHWPKDGLYSRRAPMLGFVIKGIVAIPFGNYSLHCRAGHSFIVLPGTPHSDGSHLLLDNQFLNDGAREIFYSMPRGNGVECWLSRAHDQRVHQKRSGESYYVPHPLARQYLETLTEEIALRRSHFIPMGNALMIALITLLLREIQETRAFQPATPQQMPSSLQALPSHEQNPMVRAEEYIQSHLQGDLTIDTVAKHLYMSRAYFTRLFRAHAGKTFVEYVTQCRLEEAKVLLHDTEWPVNRIGEVVGLKPSRFRAVFHEFIGVSPIKFRQQSREIP
jgi:AraC-like DNA-binding protein